MRCTKLNVSMSGRFKKKDVYKEQFWLELRAHAVRLTAVWAEPPVN